MQSPLWEPRVFDTQVSDAEMRRRAIETLRACAVREWEKDGVVLP